MTISDGTPARADAADDAGWGTEQSRVVSWRDPLTTQATVASMSGLAYWRAVDDAKLPPPPIGELMRMDITEVDKGRIAFHLYPG
jgi:hypothetical protein